MVQRVTYRRRHSYNTISNRTKLVKTPGGRTVVHYRTKTCKAPRCGDCGITLIGLPRLRPAAYSRLPKRQRRVSRAYGGSRCYNCTRNRIVRAFLIEEQKIVKHVIKMKAQKAKAASKPEGEKKPKEKKQPKKPETKAKPETKKKDTSKQKTEPKKQQTETKPKGAAAKPKPEEKPAKTAPKGKQTEPKPAKAETTPKTDAGAPAAAGGAKPKAEPPTKKAAGGQPSEKKPKK